MSICPKCNVEFEYSHTCDVTVKPEIQVDNLVSSYQHPKMEYWAEEYECAMMHLDDLGIPKDDGRGNGYSLVGRIDIAIKQAQQDVFNGTP